LWSNQHAPQGVVKLLAHESESSIASTCGTFCFQRFARWESTASCSLIIPDGVEFASASEKISDFPCRPAANKMPNSAASAGRRAQNPNRPARQAKYSALAWDRSTRVAGKAPSPHSAGREFDFLFARKPRTLSAFTTGSEEFLHDGLSQFAGEACSADSC